MSNEAGTKQLAYNAQIYETKLNYMKNKAIGIYYIEMPNKIVRGMFGEVVEPKNNKGNKFIIQNRKQISIKNLPKFTISELKQFKQIFCHYD